MPIALHLPLSFLFTGAHPSTQNFVWRRAARHVVAASMAYLCASAPELCCSLVAASTTVALLLLLPVVILHHALIHDDHLHTRSDCSTRRLPQLRRVHFACRESGPEGALALAAAAHARVGSEP